MQLSNRVTLPKNTPHNRDYVACSAFPGNGILKKNSCKSTRGSRDNSSVEDRLGESLHGARIAPERLECQGSSMLIYDAGRVFSLAA